MLDPVTALGLTSSIIAIIELAYKVGKRTKELSELAGRLPPDLIAIKDLIDLVSKTCERLKRQIRDVEPGIGPRTEYGETLDSAFKRCADVSSVFLRILDQLNGSTPFSMALKATRKQGELQKLRNLLEENILSIIFLLSESSAVQSNEIKYVVPFSNTILIHAWK
jgi:hypothetical protein